MTHYNDICLIFYPARVYMHRKPVNWPRSNDERAILDGRILESNWTNQVHLPRQCSHGYGGPENRSVFMVHVLWPIITISVLFSTRRGSTWTNFRRKIHTYVRTFVCSGFDLCHPWMTPGSFPFSFPLLDHATHSPLVMEGLKIGLFSWSMCYDPL
jgi:hypothetical protein